MLTHTCNTTQTNLSLIILFLPKECTSFNAVERLLCFNTNSISLHVILLVSRFHILQNTAAVSRIRTSTEN